MAKTKKVPTDPSATSATAETLPPEPMGLVEAEEILDAAELVAKCDAMLATVQGDVAVEVTDALEEARDVAIGALNATIEDVVRRRRARAIEAEMRARGVRVDVPLQPGPLGPLAQALAAMPQAAVTDTQQPMFAPVSAGDQGIMSTGQHGRLIPREQDPFFGLKG
jgi:hypothetical protein